MYCSACCVCVSALWEWESGSEIVEGGINEARMRRWIGEAREEDTEAGEGRERRRER